jgi:hypothetical protein
MDDEQVEEHFARLLKRDMVRAEICGGLLGVYPAAEKCTTPALEKCTTPRAG